MDSRRSLIVNYHYCLDVSENPYLSKTAVHPATFRQQVAELARLERDKGVSAFVTFDDGTRDVWLNAVPTLIQFGVPATLFVCTLPLAENRVLNVTKIHMLQGKLGLTRFRQRFMAALDAIGETFEMDDGARFGLGKIYRYDTDDVREFKLLLNVQLPYPVVSRILDTLFEGEFGSQEEAVKALYMSFDDLLRARDCGMMIGLHTHSHFMLGRLDAAEQESEITACRTVLSEVLGDREMELSYPYGVPGTWNHQTKDILARAGISRAFTLGRKMCGDVNPADRFEVPRFDVNDVFNPDSSIRADLF